MSSPSRRRFCARLGLMLAGMHRAACSALRRPIAAQPERVLPTPSPSYLPRWRGFNLFDLYSVTLNRRLQRSDFELIEELNFNFVRVPLDYRLWTDPRDWTRIHEPALENIDTGLEWGHTHNIHVQLNFHRAPGYSVSRAPEPKSLWRDDEALSVCALHWATLARRYRGHPNSHVSFNLVNEPAGVDATTHRRVVERLVQAIRSEDPGRLIVCDGRDFGNVPPDELAGLDVAAATRGYQPMQLTHYQAGWIDGADTWPHPEYPVVGDAGSPLTRDRMRARWIEPWLALRQRGIGVMVGEFGAYSRTPHRVVLAWMEDMLALWREAGWGWALWNFRGSFGVLDSGRSDVAYERWRGHRLDRAMLNLLQRF
jgi:endoglucanase